jgi:hypothetical protein
VYELVYEYVKNKVDLSAIRGLVTPSFRGLRVFRSSPLLFLRAL